jgi:hypothetical protein
MAAPLKDIPSPAAPDAAGFEDVVAVVAVEAVEELAAAVATVEVAAADWRVDGTVMEPVGAMMEELPNG